jgi:hypothetical protein
MEIPKDKILEMLKQQGKSDQVDQAKQELPDEVDPEQHSDQLQSSGATLRSCFPSSAAASPASRASAAPAHSGPPSEKLAVSLDQQPRITWSEGQSAS